jgi:ankyrin repeat protein
MEIDVNTATETPETNSGLTTHRECTDLHKASRLGDLTSIKRILKLDPAKINEADCGLGWTPIYRTVICGHIEATRYLLKHGANPNTTNNLGETPLH